MLPKFSDRARSIPLKSERRSNFDINFFHPKKIDAHNKRSKKHKENQTESETRDWRPRSPAARGTTRESILHIPNTQGDTQIFTSLAPNRRRLRCRRRHCRRFAMSGTRRLHVRFGGGGRRGRGHEIGGLIHSGSGRISAAVLASSDGGQDLATAPTKSSVSCPSPQPSSLSSAWPKPGGQHIGSR